MPDYRLFGLVLVLIGVSAQTFNVSANSLVQISTEPAMRGRVLAILMAIFAGGTPLGAPIVGRVADTLGPRWALGVGALAGVAAAAIGAWYQRWGIVESGILSRYDPGRESPSCPRTALARCVQSRIRYCCHEVGNRLS